MLAQDLRGAPGRRSRQNEFSENFLGLKKGLPLFTPLLKFAFFGALKGGGALEGDFGAISGEKLRGVTNILKNTVLVKDWGPVFGENSAFRSAF